MAEKKKYICNLCNNYYNHICEFVIMAKHVRGHTRDGIKLLTNGKQRVIKHICTNCFIKMFPDSVK